ncbi:MAG TPA: hypothetical protein VKP14_07650 [Gaiellaceae bacterium]|nr:hypothetical protein [Gaiellaceae bacterium]
MADWVVISSVASAGGTLALAGTTYFSIRSANRAARVAELSLLATLRPLLVSSSPEDATQHVGFFDDVDVDVPGGGAGVVVDDGRIYIVISLRNVGPGIGVLYGGFVHGERLGASQDHPPVEEFRMLSRDLYIAPGKLGFWQVAFREEDARREEVLAGIESGRFGIDLLYGDYEGGQRVITRFGLVREDDRWNLVTARHWQLDRPEIARPRGSFVEGRYQPGA